MPTPPFIRAIVAPGRTVYGDHEEMTETVFRPGGLAEVPTMKEYGPGMEISLPEDEVIRLRALGFLER